MATNDRWEYVESIKAHDDKGNPYVIVKEQWIVTVRPISGPASGQLLPTRGKIRFTCDGEAVKQLSNDQYQLVPSAIILTPDSPEI